MTAEPRRTLRSHSAAEPQLNEVGFEEPAVWSQENQKTQNEEQQRSFL